jgi:hypothetical protein
MLLLTPSISFLFDTGTPRAPAMRRLATVFVFSGLMLPLRSTWGLRLRIESTFGFFDPFEGPSFVVSAFLLAPAIGVFVLIAVGTAAPIVTVVGVEFLIETFHQHLNFCAKPIADYQDL